MDRDLGAILKSLIQRIKSADFSLDFFIDALSAILWLLNWVDSEPDVYVSFDPEIQRLLAELQGILIPDAEPVIKGPLTGIIIAMIIRALVDAALEALEGAELPAAVIDMIKKWLDALLSRV